MSNEDPFYQWNDLRDAEGKSGQVGAIVDRIVEAAEQKQHVQIEPLSEILFIPGVLCSAAPRVVREFLAAIPKATAKAKQDLLSVIFCLSEILSAPNQEAIERHSNGAISPYGSYELLRKAIISAIQMGEQLYRSEFPVRERRKVTDRELFAAVLLSKCDVADPVLLDVFDNAIAADADQSRQALLFNAAVDIASRCGKRSDYLARYLHPAQDSADFSTTRLLSASYLADSLSDVDLREAFGAPGARQHVSLPDILAPLGSNTRFRIFKTIFRDGRFLQGEPLLFALELLRSAFNDPANHKGRHFYLDVDRHPHTNFLFATSPAKARLDFNATEREALRVLADCDALWEEQSNLWRQFGLPDSREAMRQLGARSSCRAF